MKKELVHLSAALMTAACLLFSGTANSNATGEKARSTVHREAGKNKTASALPAHSMPGTAFPGIIYIEM